MRFGRVTRHHSLAGVAALAILFSCVVVAAQETEEAAPKADTSAQAVVEEVALQPAPAPISTPAALSGQRFHAVNLRVDGSLAGRVSVIEPSGMLKPVRARISFVQNGEEVASVRSDEWGRFQVPGLEPKVYSVLAKGQEGFGAFSVQVLPYDKDVDKARMLLDLTLAPAEDAKLLSEMLAEAASGNPDGTEEEDAVVSGGGGGGGYGALLGLGGLAGLAGLAGEKERPLATPFKPDE